tara:strand:- start:5908 stop:6051 length:144 start_codon:yes stop_codon:yes gene_type:complete
MKVDKKEIKIEEQIYNLHSLSEALHDIANLTNILVQDLLIQTKRSEK